MTHDLACLLEPDGRLHRANSAWEASLGWAHADLEGHRFSDFAHPDDRSVTEIAFHSTVRGVATLEFENRFRGKDGADRKLQWRMALSRRRDMVCVVGRDITGESRLERELIEAGDREKERIGRELHDGLCQSLAGIAALSATLARKLGARDDPASAGAAELTALLQQSVGDARDLARGLDWAGLARLGLPAALETLAANTQALHPVSCALVYDGRLPALAPAVETHLYRIAQEAVSNAVSHARATRIVIGLGFRKRLFTLSVRDDGIGIPERKPEGGGIGLRTMTYRARLIGASLKVERTSPHGTLAMCALAVKSPTAKPVRIK